MQPGAVQAPVIQQVKKHFLIGTLERKNIIVITKEACIFGRKLKWNTKSEMVYLKKKKRIVLRTVFLKMKKFEMLFAMSRLLQNSD